MRPTSEIVPGAIERPRLSELLDERWTRRVVCVVAGAGFGKSTLLAQAVARGDGRDHLVALDGTCAVTTELLRRVTAGLGIAAVDVAGVVRALGELDGARCLLVDDVHLVDESSPGMRTLRTLVERLPPDVHLVLASRRRLPFALARARAAGEVLDLGEAELAYTDDEVAAIACANGSDPATLAAAGGWPALVSLTALAGHQGALEFLTEEVLDQLDPKVHGALTVAVLAESADVRLLRDLAGYEGDPVELAETVPLVAVDTAGTLTPHALWTSAIERQVLPDERRRILGRIAGARRAGGDHRGALRAAARSGDTSAFAEVVRDIGQLGHIALNIDEIDQWLTVAPEAFRTTPEGRLLAAISARAADPFGDVTRDRLTEVWHELRDAGIVGCEVVAMSELAFVHRARGEPAEMMPLVARLFELDAAGHEVARSLATFARAGVAEQLGDVDGALAALDELRVGDLSDGWMALVEFQRCNHLLLLGRPREALEAAERSQGLGTPGYLGGWCAVRSATWHLGVTAAAVDALPNADEVEGASLVDRIWMGSWFGAMQAFAGRLDVAVRNIGCARSALRSDSQPELVGFVRWAEAAYAVADGDPDRARAQLAGFLAEHPLDSPTGRRLASRAPALFALLLDALDELRASLTGPWQQRTLDVAERLVRLRRGEPADPLPDPGDVLTALPLPWAIELAALADATGDPGAAALAARVRDVGGDACDVVVDQLDPGSRDRARRLLGTDTTATGDVVVVLGPVGVAVEPTPDGSDELRRRRVRELLARIAIDGPVRREVVAASLWPDATPEQSSRNLRVNLTYLGRVRTAGGERIVVDRDDGLALHPDLTTDLAWFERWTAEGEAARRAGAARAALGAFERALDLVRAEPLADTRTEHWFEREATRLDHAVTTTAVRAAELAAELGEHARAVGAAEVALRLDPYDEAAHRHRVEALLATGDVGAASRAAAEARDRLGELGVDPDPATATVLDLAT